MGVLSSILPGGGGGGDGGGGDGGALGFLSKILDPLGLFAKKGGGGAQQAGGAPGAVPRPTPTMGPQMSVPFQAGQAQPFIGLPSAQPKKMGGSTADLQALLAMLSNTGSGG